MSTEENKAALHRAVENWNKGDLNAYLQLYDLDCNYPGVGVGLDPIKKFYEDFWIAFPGNQLVLGDVIAEGDKVACNFILTGTHQGNMMGIPPTGKQVKITGSTIMRFGDGKCVERWSQSDFLGLLQQLGVAPAHG
ncbi:MAG: hypothetical protein BroJett011_65790 [Chloroflexota bacterium]|nr:MAG: hypothetical protein BroJett011_65790 [Chloroflexota bacterium]